MRMHFWLDVARVKGRRSLPVKTSLNGTMPALVNMSVGSFWGMSGAEGQTSWPFPLKKSRNDARTSEAVFEAEPNMFGLRYLPLRLEAIDPSRFQEVGLRRSPKMLPRHYELGT